MVSKTCMVGTVCIDPSVRDVSEIYFVTPENRVFSIGKNQYWEPLRALAWKSVKVWGDVFVEKGIEGESNEPIFVVRNFEIRNV